MHVITAWKDWWDGIGHVARCRRDPGRTREAFEAGYLAALEDAAHAQAAAFGVQRDMRTSDEGNGIGGSRGGLA
jgi:hypothetical protein